MAENLHIEDDRKFDLRKYILLILIGSAIFLLPYARIVYYDELIGYLEITPLQLGSVLALYGTFSTVGTFFSGLLADRYSAKWCLVISLLLTGAGGFILLSKPSYYGFMGLYMLWGLSITLTYNSPHYKAIRYVGSAKSQGKLFGSVGGLRFLVSGLFGLAAAAIYSNTITDDSTIPGFVNVVIFYTAIYFVIAFLIIVLWKKDKPLPLEERFRPGDAIPVLKHPATWFIGFIIYGVYAMGRCLDLMAPYMKDTLQIDPGTTAYVNTVRSYFCAVGSGIILGILLDRSRRKILLCQIFTAVAVVGWLSMAMMPTQGSTWHIIFCAALLIGVTAQMGAYLTAFSLLEGANVPKKITGSIIGVAISIGFLPDIIINYFSNYLANIYGPAQGCVYLLYIGAAHGVFAIFMYQMFKYYLKRINARTAAE